MVPVAGLLVKRNCSTHCRRRARSGTTTIASRYGKVAPAMTRQSGDLPTQLQRGWSGCPGRCPMTCSHGRPAAGAARNDWRAATDIAAALAPPL